MAGKFLGAIAGIAGALAGSQAPAFTLQYMQNLTGRVAELKPIVEQFDADAAEFGVSRDEGLKQFEESDGLPKRQGERVGQTIRRYEALSAHLAELQAANDYTRPLVLMRGLKSDIAESTMEVFKPAVPTTPDGAAWAAGGAGGIWGVFSIIWGLLAQLAGVRRRA